MATDELVFLHFNDVYHIGCLEHVAEFATQLGAWRRKYAHRQPLTIFSGDVFSPSLEASILTGAHMIPLLNHLKIDIGCYGNHDFDFGEKRLLELAADVNFPWLLSNALRLRKSDRQSCADESGTLRHGALLAGAGMYHVKTVQGYKIGFFGLAGTDWPSNCRELPGCAIVSPVETAQTITRHLRRVEKCDFVIAITHMRLLEDLDVSEATRTADDTKVDLVLGGHDHDIVRRRSGEAHAKDPVTIDATMDSDDAIIVGTGMLQEVTGDIRIVKSGTDWKNLSCVRLEVSRSPSGTAHLHQVHLSQVADIRKIPHDPAALALSLGEVHACLQGVNTHISALGTRPLLLSEVALEGTGSIVRSRESNLANMLADMVRAYYGIDVAFVNSGGIRCDRVIPATGITGTALTVRDIIDIVPFNNAFVVKRVSSPALFAALENSVSDAHTDGRFMHFSGLEIVADWKRPEGSRVLEVYQNMDPNSASLRLSSSDERIFSIAMVAFIAEGFDGYGCFIDEETIVSEEGAMTDTEMLLRILGYTPANETTEDRDDEAEEQARIERARMAVIRKWDESTGLPIVAPGIEGRIRFV